MPKIVDRQIARSDTNMRCREPQIRNGHQVPCGGCRGCNNAWRHNWYGRLGAESFTCHMPLLCTPTYDDDHVEGTEFPQPEHIKQLMKNLSRNGFPCKRWATHELGLKTGRPHWHLLLFPQLSPKQLSADADRLAELLPLDVRHDSPLWRHGFIQFEAPRSEAASVGYLLNYIDKGGIHLRPSVGIGKRYLFNYARRRAELKLPLVNSRGVLKYTVPGARKSNGKHYRYEVLPSHAWYAPLIQLYVETFIATHGYEPPTQSFKSDWDFPDEWEGPSFQDRYNPSY